MTKTKAASLLVQLYSVYCKYYPSSSFYEEAISMAIMALERIKDDEE